MPRIKHIMEEEQASALLLAFMPDECPYGGNHGGLCDASCYDPYGLPGFGAVDGDPGQLSSIDILVMNHDDENCLGCSYCLPDMEWAGPMETSLY